MHLHPELAAALIAQRQRDLIHRADRHRIERPVGPIRIRRRRRPRLDPRWA